jgi:hypothetical protein
MTNENGIDLLREKPEEHLLGKLNEVLEAMVAMKSRVDVLEDHLVFLLSKSPDYQALMKAHAAEMKEKKNVVQPTNQPIH